MRGYCGCRKANLVLNFGLVAAKTYGVWLVRGVGCDSSDTKVEAIHGHLMSGDVT